MQRTDPPATCAANAELCRGMRRQRPGGQREDAPGPPLQFHRVAEAATEPSNMPSCVVEYDGNAQAMPTEADGKQVFDALDRSLVAVLQRDGRAIDGISNSGTSLLLSSVCAGLTPPGRPPDSSPA